MRAAFVSDVHLGSKGCRADQLLEFLKSVEVEYLFLVGDIVDLWAMKKNFYWPQEHNNVLRCILGKAKGGTRVIYVPGNHDEEMREFCGSIFGNLEIHREFVHRTADDRELLVMHGDEFDAVVKCSPWLANLGSTMYEFLLWMNRYVNSVRRMFGMPYWSLASYLKHRVKNAVQYISSFEQAVAHAARKRGVDGVVCGHIHRPEITDIDGVQYCNDGDWVESCSALVEDLNGRLSIWTWPEVRDRVMQQPLVEVAA
jgi:UDP-2,3-diacylglucosamine pyrophosphatase LpxH